MLAFIACHLYDTVSNVSSIFVPNFHAARAELAVFARSTVVTTLMSDQAKNLIYARIGCQSVLYTKRFSMH